MGFYPAFLNLSGKECLVVGGGRLALHKTRRFARGGGSGDGGVSAISAGFRRMKEVRLNSTGLSSVGPDSGAVVGHCGHR
jgi:hypothetical protein